MAALHLEMLRVATEDLNSKDAQLELLIATATLNERDLRAAQRENAELLADNERLKNDLAAANHVADQALVQLEAQTPERGSAGSSSDTGADTASDTPLAPPPLGTLLPPPLLPPPLGAAPPPPAPPPPPPPPPSPPYDAEIDVPVVAISVIPVAMDDISEGVPPPYHIYACPPSILT
jgi:hypothetical protein